MSRDMEINTWATITVPELAALRAELKAAKVERDARYTYDELAACMERRDVEVWEPTVDDLRVRMRRVIEIAKAHREAANALRAEMETREANAICHYCGEYVPLGSDEANTHWRMCLENPATKELKAALRVVEAAKRRIHGLSGESLLDAVREWEAAQHSAPKEMK